MPAFFHKWKEFRQSSLPTTSDPALAKQLQTIFYSGALAIIVLQTEWMRRGDGETITDRDLREIADIRSEIEEFCQQVCDDEPR